MLKLIALDAIGFKNLNVRGLQFPLEGNIIIVGKNGSGKSSLFDAIFFALTGEAVPGKRRGGRQDVISKIRNAADVTLKFQKDGNLHEIHRVLNGTSMQTTFKRDIGTPQETTYSSVKAGMTQEKVESEILKLLGFDSDVLRNSCFVEQKKLEGFMDDTPKERKKVIKKLLNLERLASLQESYEKKKKDLTNCIKQFEKQNQSEELGKKIQDNEKEREVLLERIEHLNPLLEVESLLSSIEGTDVEKMVKEAMGEKTVKEAKKMELEVEIADLNDIRGRLDLIRREKGQRENLEHELKLEEKNLQDVNNAIVSKQESLSNLSENVKKRETLKVSLDGLRREREQVSTVKQSHENLKEIDDTLREFENEKKIALSERDFEIKNFTGKELNILKGLLPALEGFQGNVNDLKAGLKRKDELERLLEDLNTRMEGAKTRGNLLQQREEAQLNLDIARRDVADCEGGLKRARDLETERDEITRDMTRLQNTINDAEKEIEAFQVELESRRRYESKKEERDGIQSEIDGLESNLEENQKKIDDLLEDAGFDRNDASVPSVLNGGQVMKMLQEKRLLEASIKEATVLQARGELSIFKKFKKVLDRYAAEIEGDASFLKRMGIYFGLPFVAAGIALAFLVNTGFVAIAIVAGIASVFLHAFSRPIATAQHRQELKDILSKMKEHIEKSPPHPKKFITARAFNPIRNVKDWSENLSEQEAELMSFTGDGGNPDVSPRIPDSFTSMNYNGADDAKRFKIEGAYFFKLDGTCNYELYENIKKARQDLEQLERDLLVAVEAQEKGARIKDALSSLQGKSEHFSTELEKKKIEWLECKEELDSMHDVPSRTSDEIMDSINSARDQARVARGTLNPKGERLVNIERELETISMDELDSKMASANEALVDAEKTFESITRQLASYEGEEPSKIEEYGGRIDNTREELRACTDTINDCSGKLAYVLQEHGFVEPGKAGSMENEALIQASTTRIQTIQDIAGAYKQRVSTLEAGLQDVDGTWESIETRYPMQSAARELKQLKVLHETITGINARIKEIEEHIHETKLGRAAVEDQIPEAYKDPDAFNKWQDEINNRYSTKTADLKNVEQSIGMVDPDLVNSEINELQVKLKQVQARIDEIRANITRIEESISQKEETIPERFQASPDSIKGNIEDLSSEISTLNEDIARVNAEINRINNDYKGYVGNLISRINSEERLQVEDITMAMDAYTNARDENGVGTAQLEILLQATRKKLTELSKDLLSRSAIEPPNEDGQPLSVNLVKELLGERRTSVKEKHDILVGELNTNRETLEKLKNKGTIVAAVKRFMRDRDSSLSAGKLLETATEERDIVEKSGDIIEKATGKIMQMVIPKTIEHLTKILPILTTDKYKDVKIDDEYEITVLDPKLGEYVKKSFFSGGEIDQIALGLRLAFAIATTGEAANEDSFIFLDEPLGFFDDETKASLVEFLTNGNLINWFEQRFIISNFSQITKYFDHVIEMDDGQVILQSGTGTQDSLQPFLVGGGGMGEVNMLEVTLVELFDEASACEADYDIRSKVDGMEIKVELSIVDPSTRATFNPVELFLSKDEGQEGRITVYFTRNLVGDVLELHARLTDSVDGTHLGYQVLELDTGL
ncbi:MAG: AAA family ATPase [Promethearchaeota archaeon]